MGSTRALGENEMKKWVLLISSVLLLAGCQAPNTYYWANYEPLVYSNYAQPGEIQPAEQVQLLQADEAKAQEKGLPLPPGFYAYLGYLYSLTGDNNAAVASFQSEKQNFPESAVFMDRLMGGARK